MPEFDGVAMAVLVTVASVLGTPTRVAEAVAYQRLRAVREGDARALAEVFE